MSKRSNKVSQDVSGFEKLNKENLLKLCNKNQLYRIPHLNDILYLHYQKFRDIEGLEDYTGLKCLWLECNAVSEIKGLTNQPLLKCLFLQHNLISKIENLNMCRELDTINLSYNQITNIENCGIDILPVLTNLNLSNNYIRTYNGLNGLLECKMISILDLGNNRIEDCHVVKIFSKLPNLRVLTLQGNPFVRQILQYRKTLILECKNLTNLDNRPISSQDRACAEAWKRGGYDEEKAENNRWKKIDQNQIMENINAIIRLRNYYKKNNKEKIKLLKSDDENLKAIHYNENGITDLEYELQEPEEILETATIHHEILNLDFNISSYLTLSEENENKQSESYNEAFMTYMKYSNLLKEIANGNKEKHLSEMDENIVVLKENNQNTIEIKTLDNKSSEKPVSLTKLKRNNYRKKLPAKCRNNKTKFKVRKTLFTIRRKYSKISSKRRYKKKNMKNTYLK